MACAISVNGQRKIPYSSESCIMQSVSTQAPLCAALQRLNFAFPIQSAV